MYIFTIYGGLRVVYNKKNCLLLLLYFDLGVIGRQEFFFFVPALLLSIPTPVFLPSSSVSLSYFVLAVPLRECLRKHLCMSSQFPVAILNGT